MTNNNTSVSTNGDTRVLRSTSREAAWKVTFEDVRAGIGRSNLWLMLGVLEVKRRYRRTKLGPFWAAGHIALYIICVGFVFSTVLEKDRQTYIPFLATGFIPWMFVYNSLQEAGSSFSSASSLRSQLAFPYSMFVFQSLWRNLVVHLHNYSLYLLLILIYPVNLGWPLLLLIPGYILVIANLFWMSMLIATVSARYRDVQQLVAAVIQVAIFVTPIFYDIDKLSQFQRDWLLPPNLLYHLTVVLRAPLLGNVPPLSSYVSLVIALIVGTAFTAWLFGRKRERIIYWIM